MHISFQEIFRFPKNYIFIVQTGPRKNKVSKIFQKIFILNFEAKHTKGLKPFRAHSGYRNLLGVRGSPFTEEKV